MCRSLAVHPTMPYLLSSSDDMLIKLWDWEKGWMCTQIFEGHSHYVMQVGCHVHTPLCLCPFSACRSATTQEGECITQEALAALQPSVEEFMGFCRALRSAVQGMEHR